MRFALLISMFTLAACGATTSSIADAGTNTMGLVDCDDIVAACHSVDPGSGDIHDCHENAEGAWQGAQCTSNKPRCVALCTNARDAGR